MKTPSLCHLLLATAAVCASGPASAQAKTPRTGKQVYETVCQACHMPGGAGDAGTYPALARNPKLAVAGYPMSVVVLGQKAMPAFGQQLSDQEVADVVNYVRSSFGNKFKGKAIAGDVHALRQ